jgi:hypothetical protein
MKAMLPLALSSYAHLLAIHRRYIENVMFIPFRILYELSLAFHFNVSFLARAKFSILVRSPSSVHHNYPHLDFQSFWFSPIFRRAKA